MAEQSKAMWRDQIPPCMVGGPIDDASTRQEAVDIARTELDLIAEGQDGTEHYSVADVRRIESFVRANQ